ncbi:MAG TPA: GNAT family N-acetyltransferase [Streptosporangiaceae bacterium]
MHKQGSKVQAAVPVAEFRDYLPSTLYRWQDLLSSRGIPALKPSGLLVGPSQGYQTHFLAADDRTPVDVAAAIIEDVRSLPSADASGQRPCVAMYLTTADVRAARSAGVRSLPVLLEADAWIPVPAEGWEAWIGSQSRQRRTNIRSEVRRFRAAGYEITYAPLADCYEKAAPLAASTHAKYGIPGDAEHYARVMRTQGEAMGDAAQVALCSLDGNDPVGFCIFYMWRDSLFIRWAGFDYDRLTRAAEYFNLVLYNQISLAASAGLRWIHAGVKSTASKALRGAELRPLWMLDLTEDTPLAHHDQAIRASNARQYADLTNDPRTTAAIADPEEWLEFS